MRWRHRVLTHLQLTVPCSLARSAIVKFMNIATSSLQVEIESEETKASCLLSYELYRYTYQASPLTMVRTKLSSNSSVITKVGVIWMRFNL
jgi:hypothetical protein